MIQALFRALADLGDPRLRRFIWLSIGGAIAVFVLIWVAVWFLLTGTAITQWTWLDTVVDVLGGLAVLIVSVLLFPGVVGLVSSLMLEEVAAAVEARDYPVLDPARRQGVAEMIRVALKFAAVAVFANLVVLPLYLVPIVNVVVFYLLNGYLLGREFYELVALRRLDERAARDLRRGRRLRWLAMGSVIALLMSIPVINLIGPILAAAFAVHVFEGARTR